MLTDTDAYILYDSLPTATNVIVVTALTLITNHRWFIIKVKSVISIIFLSISKETKNLVLWMYELMNGSQKPIPQLIILVLSNPITFQIFAFISHTWRISWCYWIQYDRRITFDIFALIHIWHIDVHEDKLDIYSKCHNFKYVFQYMS